LGVLEQVEAAVGAEGGDSAGFGDVVGASQAVQVERGVKLAMTWGAVPVRMVERSSSKVTSRTPVSFSHLGRVMFV
jgi:hypothetical protein